jgi:hypothetical protein
VQQAATKAQETLPTGEQTVADAAVLTFPAAESDFSIGRCFTRTFNVLTRHFLMFSAVMAVAAAPSVALIGVPTINSSNSLRAGVIVLVATFLSGILGILGQAVVVHGAFQDMRHRRVDFTESLKVGLSRFLPVLGLAILVMLGMWLGFMLLIIPGLILMVRWYIAAPACVVERIGPRASMKRSAELTKGHRWKVFGAIILLYMGAGIATQVVTTSFTTMGGPMLGLAGSLIAQSITGAFVAIFVVVTYYELRVAKEGVDIDQIASVFD